MKITNFYLIESLILFFLLTSTGAIAADIKAGKVAATQCAMCHGVDGRGNGVPGSSIAGMSVEKFKQCLHDFKNGTRRNVIMKMFVNRLSEQDFDNLAAFYATQ
ncbi:c-type cytochrome [Kaarinaea lacus]